MKFYILLSIYFFSLFLSIYWGIKRYRILDRSTKVLVFENILSLLFELIALYAEIKYRNNLAVYNVAVVSTLLFMCWYFRRLMPQLQKKWYVSVYISLVVIWLGSIYYEHTMYSLNNYYMEFAGIVSICFSIYSIEQAISIHAHSYFKLTRYVHFWFALLISFYWSSTLLQWMAYKYVSDKSWLNDSLVWMGVCNNLGYGILYYLYPKFKQYPSEIKHKTYDVSKHV